MKNGDKQVYPLQNHDGAILQTGLTKREYFAGLVLKGLLSNTDLRIQNYEPMVSLSLVYADELLKQLENETTK